MLHIKCNLSKYSQNPSDVLLTSHEFRHPWLVQLYGRKVVFDYPNAK